MSNLMVQPAHLFVSYLNDRIKNRISNDIIGYYHDQTINDLPYIIMSYEKPKIPVFNKINVMQSEAIIMVTSSFNDMGIGKILRCGFIIEPNQIDEYCIDGFEDATLNGYKIINTSTNTDTSKLVTIDKNVTSNFNSKYSAKIMSIANQTTKMSCNINGPFDFSFKWKVSSEEKYDLLRWYVDNQEIKSISGEVNWEKQYIHLEEGSHQITFSYQKDGSRDQGNDCGWIDDIVLGKTYKKYDALNIPTKINENFSLDITRIIENVNYIAAFVENPAGIAISENIIYRSNNGWQSGKIMNVMPEHINKIILGKCSSSRRKIKNIYIGKTKM